MQTIYHHCFAKIDWREFLTSYQASTNPGNQVPRNSGTENCQIICSLQAHKIQIAEPFVLCRHNWPKFPNTKMFFVSLQVTYLIQSILMKFHLCPWIQWNIFLNTLQNYVWFEEVKNLLIIAEIWLWSSVTKPFTSIWPCSFANACLHPSFSIFGVL